MTVGVLELAECAGQPPARIGGKALGLGKLMSLSLDVPAGFVVTTAVFTEWMTEHGLYDGVRGRLAADGGEYTDRIAGAGIAELFAGVPLVSDAIDAAYARLARTGDEPVAVRSSATGEDSEDSSYAGQQETFLWVRGADEVRRRIVECWASLFSVEAVQYRRRLGVAPEHGEMAVVVQRMVPAEAAGVMFTIDPVSGDPSQITIESTLGLGVALVGGQVTPDRYCVDKVTLELRSRSIATKPFADRLDHELGRIRRFTLSAQQGGASSLTDDEVVRLARIGKRLERAIGTPMDIEWALGPTGDEARHLYLLQARPETGRRAGASAAAPLTPMQQMISGLRRSRSNTQGDPGETKR